ncbi:DUF6291 domain-containing protein [Blautia sp. LMAG:75]|uniref:DUF6291 domain-containing protein n=1 Tax=Blautia sp. LMAG:75 TaxID=1969171 RepID=UPI0025B8A1C3|nr:DUF6291 domain-containing protein [Blautia sp. LMAG:75]
MEVKNSFVIYTDYMEQVELLTMEQRGILFTSIMAYASEKELPDMDGMTKMAFSFIKATMDRDMEKYRQTVEKRKEAGKLGGRPKADGYSEKQSKAKKANGFSEKQDKAKKPDNDSVNDNDNVNDKKTYTCAFETLWDAYPRKKEKAMAYKQYLARLNNGFSEDELMTAVKRYAEECRKNKTEQRYIKQGATFLGPNTPFEDYLRGDVTVGKPGRNTEPDETDIVRRAIEQGAGAEGFEW